MKYPIEKRNGAPDADTKQITVTVKYFASLKEESGRTEEQVRTIDRTPARLYETLRDRYCFNVDREPLQVAVNHQLSTWDTSLSSGDTVAFLPPVAGG